MRTVTLMFMGNVYMEYRGATLDEAYNAAYAANASEIEKAIREEGQVLDTLKEKVEWWWTDTFMDQSVVES